MLFFIVLISLLIVGIVIADLRRRIDALEIEVSDLRATQDESITRQQAPTAQALIEKLQATPSKPVKIIARSQKVSEQPAAVSKSVPEASAEPDMKAGPWSVPDLEPVQPETAANAEIVPDETGRPSGFEDLFGRRLPIWAGGITLIVAAVLFVKYSIDSGLLSPVVRVVLGLLFGSFLIAGAEGARRAKRFIQDDRVAQALAGAGIGCCYAATLAAHALYQLISPATAFAGLTAITALAIGLAVRFGTPCAVLALVGGLATPALVQSDAPSIPLLSGYLAIVIGSLTVLSRRERWLWLGMLALVGGMGWSLIIILTSTLNHLSTLSIGLLILLLGIAFPRLIDHAQRGTMLRAVAAIGASIQLALVVSLGGYDALSWGLYGLLALAFLWVTHKEPSLRMLMALPLGVALLLAYLWPDPPAALFASVMVGIVAIFGGSTLWRLWRPAGSVEEAGQIIFLAVAGYFVGVAQSVAQTDGALAAIGFAFALLPAVGSAIGWRSKDRLGDWRFPSLVLATGFILSWSAMYAVAVWLFPVALAAVAASLLVVARVSNDERIEHGGLVFLGVAALALIGSASTNDELARLFQTSEVQQMGQAMLRWGALAIVFSAFVTSHSSTRRGQALSSLATVFAYGCAAQIIPAPWLSMTVAGVLLIVAVVKQRQMGTPACTDSVMLTLAGIAMLWAVEPLGLWSVVGAVSLLANPFLASDLPDLGTVVRQLVVPGSLLGAALWLVRSTTPRPMRRLLAVGIGTVLLVGAHSLYKQGFAIDDFDRFVSYGLSERTVWQVILISAGLALWFRTRFREAATALAMIGITHAVLYSMFLHNPLWSLQAVGSWPIVNLLLPSFGIAFFAPRLIALMLPDAQAHVTRWGPIWSMIVMLLFAFATLRQVFVGSLLAGAPVSAFESIGWSVLAIAMAIGWLLWGIRVGERSWRVGSLVLMLGAVGKVFLIDASGLEGLMRVASFLALGFSLIGIGWLYSRSLRQSRD